MRFDPRRIPRQPSAMSEGEFIEVFGRIYEHSPWVARDTWRRGLEPGYDTVEKLAAGLAATVDAADRSRKIALIRAHPDLAGHAAVAGRLSAESGREQAGAGLGRLSEEEYRRFQSLNEAYRERFGFPFVMAVKGSDRKTIVAAFEERLGNDADTELERAIAEINQIARLRLAELAQREH